MNEATQRPPVAFVSYAREDGTHEAWVLRLATDLRRNAVDVILDQWELRPGDDIAAFMDESIARAEHLLLICTELFAQKGDARRGGVGYEHAIITGQLLTASPSETKLVPILKQGTPSTALPRYVKTRLFIDFRESARYDQSLEQLLRHLFNAHEHARPALGPPPAFTAPQRPEAVTQAAPRKWVLVAGTGTMGSHVTSWRC